MRPTGGNTGGLSPGRAFGPVVGTVGLDGAVELGVEVGVLELGAETSAEPVGPGVDGCEPPLLVQPAANTASARRVAQRNRTG